MNAGQRKLTKLSLVWRCVLENPRTFKLYYDGRSYWFWVNIPRLLESKSFVSPFSNESIWRTSLYHSLRSDFFSCQKLFRSLSIVCCETYMVQSTINLVHNMEVGRYILFHSTYYVIIIPTMYSIYSFVECSPLSCKL